MMRKKAAGWAHQYLRPYIKKLKKITLKEGEYLGIRLEIYDLPGKRNWDVSNKWPWIKWFEDTLTELNKIKDDSIEYIRDSGRIIYHELKDEDVKERKLVFTIFKNK